MKIDYDFTVLPSGELIDNQVISAVKKEMDRLSDEERLDLMNHYCKQCGSKDPNCQCWNDE